MQAELREPPLPAEVLVANAHVVARANLIVVAPNDDEEYASPMISAPPRSVAEWIDLPELDLRPGEVTHRFLKLGALFAPRAAALAAGLLDPWGPEGDFLDSFVVLGTATIDTSEGPKLLRLPSVLAPWAFDVMELAKVRVRFLPRWVRLRVTTDGVEVAPLPASAVAVVEAADQATDATASGMTKDREGTTLLTVFVDESGNTGDVASDATGFGGQRFFALVGLGDDAGPGSIAAVFTKLLAKHGVRASEMKGRAMKRRPTFVRDLVSELNPSNSIFVEITDKKFYLATNLVTFALHGRRFDPLCEDMLANKFADIITEVVDDAALAAYGEFGHSRDPQTFTAFEAVFRGALLRAKIGMGAHQEREFRLLEAIGALFDAALDERRAAPLTFLPPPDTDRKGHLVPMLPHVPAFANLLGRINRHAETYAGFRVVHDQQTQFEATLRHCLEQLDVNSEKLVAITADTVSESRADWALTGRIQLGFADSKSDPAIQAADVIARFCTQRMTAVMSGTPPPPHQDEAASLLHDVGSPGSGVGVNIVAATKVVDRFWGR